MKPQDPMLILLKELYNESMRFLFVYNNHIYKYNMLYLYRKFHTPTMLFCNSVFSLCLKRGFSHYKMGK